MLTTDAARQAGTENAVPAAEALLAILRLNGVRTIFSSPGSEWPPVWDALARPPPDRSAAPRLVMLVDD